MGEMVMEKDEAATKSSKSQSTKGVLSWLVSFLVLVLAAASYSNREYSWCLWDSLPLELLPNFSKESVFLFCILILLFVLIDAGFLGSRELPEILELSGATQKEGSDCGSSSDEVELSGVGKEEGNEEQVEDGGNTLGAVDWEIVQDVSKDEEIDRRCEEYISNFRRKTRMGL